MTDEMEKLIEAYYEDFIELPDQKFLCFNRVVDYRRTERRAVKVFIEDLENEVTSDLGTYFDAKWSFTSPMSERLFWQSIKANSEKAKEIFYHMREPVPSKEIHVYKIKFKNMSSRATSKLDKLTMIFKD